MENTNMGKKQSMGRRKIEIKKIQKKSSLEVTFSKRRTGLFKKAGELCILCGVEAAVIVFSPGGRAFVFGHPSPEAVIDLFLHQAPNNSLALVPTASGQVHGHERRQYLEALDRLGVKKERVGGGNRGFWWEAEIENMGLTELEQFGGALRELIKKAAMKVEDMTMTTTMEMKMAASRPPSSTAMVEYAAAPYVDFRGHDLALTLDCVTMNTLKYYI